MYVCALQIAKGLGFLHKNQVVHLDMKSPNVLLWHFPSPRHSRAERQREAGKVWLKIADYGISQSGLSLRVDNSPVGTPGFMAPELFEKAGQVVSAEKVSLNFDQFSVLIICGLFFFGFFLVTL